MTLKNEAREKLKKAIVEIFDKNVRGKKADTGKMNAKHDGKDGHWLEKQMGIPHNAKNSPDLYGFEMKTGSKSKTTFGDWSASYYIFKCSKNKTADFTKDKFLEMFGKANVEKNNRYSWSGDPCPKINGFNSFGQKLIIDDNYSIVAIYDYGHDSRKNKDKIIPASLRTNEIILAKWDHEWMKKKLEKKFNQEGWFKCNKDLSGTYVSISFGDPIDYEKWRRLVLSGEVFFDSGMYQGNKRNYSQWRANNKLWESLITETC